VGNKTLKSISEIAKTIPTQEREQRPAKAWLTFLRVVSMVIITQFALWNVPDGALWWIIKLPLIFLAGLAFVGIFVLGHDCGHYAFSKKRWVNDIVGTLCHLPIMNGFYAWRVAHDFHHRQTQIRKMDPDWPELLYLETESPPWYEKLAVRIGPGSPVGLFVGFWVGMLKRAFFGFLIPQMDLKAGDKFKVYLHSLLSICAVIYLLSAYYGIVGPEKFVIMYVLPAIVGTTFGALLTFMHHSHEGSPVFDKNFYEPFAAQVEGTFNVRFPRWMEWMWLDINIHLPHHIIPSIPWYHLKAATESIRQQAPQVVKEKKWSMRTMNESWSATRLKGVSQGKYQLAKK
jgi:omega-6 fatty acid desaturase (delta-12 desaturase)